MTPGLKIIYEDNHLIAVNKPAGVLVHDDITGDGTLKAMVQSYIKHRYKKPGDVYLGVIHRIDRPVSGVVIFARTSKALSRMNAIFQAREIEKNYRAIVWERTPKLEGRLVNYMVKDNSKNKSKVYDIPKSNRKKAILDYRMLSEVSHYIMLEVKPITGRSHQIRAQLAHVGSTIVGDRKYGYRKFNQDRSICLHCHSLSFQHPVKKTPVHITADLPESEFWRLF